MITIRIDNTKKELEEILKETRFEKTIALAREIEKITEKYWEKESERYNKRNIEDHIEIQGELVNLKEELRRNTFNYIQRKKRIDNFITKINKIYDTYL